MANTINIIWTALPNGFVKDRSLLKLSLLATFRLETDQNPVPANLTLADFPIQTWTNGNWTLTVPHFQFAVDFGQGNTKVTVKNEFQPEMWTALFGDPASLKV